MQVNKIIEKTKLKTFARRKGRKLSKTRKELIQNELPVYKLQAENPLCGIIHNDVRIEIGIGMAENFVFQCKNNPKTTFIGMEPYLNGIANCLKLAKENLVNNFKLWPDDADLALDNIPSKSVDIIYILFPDPWPKLKQQKRRFVNEARLKQIYDKLKKSGKFIFASDITDYCQEVKNLCENSNFIDISNSNFTHFDGYLKTKYHIKAENEGRKAEFLIYQKPA